MSARPLVVAAFGSLLLLAPALPPAAADEELHLQGWTEAHGVGLIRTWNSLGDLVCSDTAVISVFVAYGEAEAADQTVPTGFYASTSSCASFVYPMETAYECTGAPLADVRCDETGPPRYFTLDTAGNFLYVRDNFGIHFEVSGLLERHDSNAGALDQAPDVPPLPGVPA